MVAIAVVLAVGGAGLLIATPMRISGGLVVASGLFLALLGCLRDETPDRARRAQLATLLHVMGTNMLALAWGVYHYRSYLVDEDLRAAAWGMATRDFFLAAGAVGGMLALARSTRTNSSTLEMAVRLERMEKSVAVNDALLNTALRARTARDDSEWGDALAELVQQANLPDGAMSLWICTDQGWRIVAHEGLSAETAENFRQPLLNEEAPGAGVVANMAATQTLTFHHKDVEKHRWFVVDPDAHEAVEALAAVLITTREGRPVGAACLTYDPERRSAPRERDVRKTLLVWRAVFTLALGDAA